MVAHESHWEALTGDLAALQRRLAEQPSFLSEQPTIRVGDKIWGDEHIFYAARGGHRDVLQWLRAQGRPWHMRTCDGAVASGDLDLLCWLRTCAEPAPWGPETFDTAVYYGCWDILKWLRAEHCPWNVDACATAAQNNNFDVLQWLRQEGCPWDETTSSGAAYGGHFDLLKWVCSNGCPLDELICAEAAVPGRLDMLQWLRQQGCPWQEHTCDNAAANGHLDLLKWLKQQGCPWHARTCHWAALEGHLDVLQWAITEGCPWDINTCFRAAQGGHIQVLQWLRPHIRMIDHIDMLCLAAAKHCQWVTLQWLLMEIGPSDAFPDCIDSNSIQDSQLGCYTPRQWLATHHKVVWVGDVQHWLRAVAEVSSNVLQATLCPDLVGLVQTYC